MSEICPEFFKVYIPNRSSQCLLIPPAFIKNFSGTLPKKVSLQDLTGKLWHVELEEVEKNWYIQNGWQDFVTDNSLEYGDFLIFSYSQNSVFDVRLFGKDGCRKEIDLAIIKIATHVKKEEYLQAVQNDCRLPHACKRKFSQALENSADIRHCKSRIAAINVENHRVIDVEKFAMPKNPHFVAFMKRCNRYSVRIPLSALKQYEINLKQSLMLRDQRGKLWPVKVNLLKDGRSMFTTGWFDFWKHMKLQLQDKCVFEFILERGKICKEVRVQIFPAKH